MPINTHKFGMLGIALLVVLTLGSDPRDVEAAGAVGMISYLAGAAQRGDGSNWTELKSGSRIFQGDRLKTGDDGRLEATLKDGSQLRLGKGSELRLDRVRVGKKNKKKKQVKAKLFLGRVWARVTGLFGSSSKFEVSTDNAVAGVRGTRFSAAVGEGGSTTVKVYGGKVLVSNKPAYAIEGHTKENRKQVAGPQEISKDEWEDLIAGAMQMIQVASDGSISQPADFKLADAGADEFESWNNERDAMAKK